MPTIGDNAEKYAGTAIQNILFVDSLRLLLLRKEIDAPTVQPQGSQSLPMEMPQNPLKTPATQPSSSKTEERPIESKEKNPQFSQKIEGSTVKSYLESIYSQSSADGQRLLEESSYTGKEISLDQHKARLIEYCTDCGIIDKLERNGWNNGTALILIGEEQKLLCLNKKAGKIDNIRSYTVSTAKNGIGAYTTGSGKTPEGLSRCRMRYHAKYSDKTGMDRFQVGTKYKMGATSSEIGGTREDGTAYMTTRVIGLEVQEETSRSAIGRIYMHGTNKEQSLGTPSSGGCIRLSNIDVLEISQLIQDGTLLEVRSSWKDNTGAPIAINRQELDAVFA